MTWNLILAVVPAVLAVALFGRRHTRTAAWWAGLVAFGLFLPNAPYVITDLIHLRSDAARTASGSVMVVGVLPLYAAFVAVGFLAYLISLQLLVREVHSVRPDIRRWQIEVSVHFLASIGIVLGRLGRLNSWDTLTAPATTLEKTFTTLTWRGAPFAVAAVFVAVWVTHSAMRTLVVAATRTVRRAV
jgi:uncharacterized membrane protein